MRAPATWTVLCCLAALLASCGGSLGGSRGDDGLLVKAETLCLERRYDDAIPVLKQHLAARPDDAGAHYYLGRCYALANRPWPAIARGELETALDLFRKQGGKSPLARFDDQAFEMACHLEIARVDRDEFVNLLKVEEIIEVPVKPDLVSALPELIRRLPELGEVLSEEHAQAPAVLARLRERRDEIMAQWREAAENARNVAPDRVEEVLRALDPEAAQRPSGAPEAGLFAQGEYLCLEQRWREAMDVLQLYLLGYPDDAGAHYYLGRCYLAMDDDWVGLARSRFEQALGLFYAHGKKSPIDRFDDQYFEMICNIDMAKVDLAQMDRLLEAGASPRLLEQVMAQCLSAAQRARSVAPDRPEVMQLEEILRQLGPLAPTRPAGPPAGRGWA